MSEKELREQYVARLEAERDRLEQLVCDFQAAAMIDVGNQDGPCLVEPRHLEAEMTWLRSERDRLKLGCWGLEAWLLGFLVRHAAVLPPEAWGEIQSRVEELHRLFRPPGRSGDADPSVVVISGEDGGSHSR